MLWTNKKTGKGDIEKRVFNLSSQQATSNFQLKYDETQHQLHRIAAMDNLLSGNNCYNLSS